MTNVSYHYIILTLV